MCMMHGRGLCVWGGGMLLGVSLTHISAITDCGQTAVSTAEAAGAACTALVSREHTAGPWMAQSEQSA